MDYKFNLDFKNLKRVRFDEQDVDKTYKRFKEHIIDFYHIKDYIISSELASETGKSHYHFLGYVEASADTIRKRLKSHVYKTTEISGQAAVSDNWKTTTKFKHLQEVFTMLEINYAHFHAYYICKDGKVINNTLYPLIKKDGYKQILNMLPQTVQNIKAQKKTRAKTPNYLMLLLEKYKNTQKSPNSLCSTREKQVKIANFVLSEISDWNQSGDEHLAKLGDNLIVKRFCQTIYNTFHINEKSDDAREYKEEFIYNIFRV